MKKTGARRAPAARPARKPSATHTAASTRKTAKTPPARRERAAPRPAAFPHLRAFLSGYLHQDFLLDHPTPADALRAFLAEANASERQALRDDVRAFLAATDGASWRDALEAFVGLGGAWLPSNRRALFSLLAGVE